MKQKIMIKKLKKTDIAHCCVIIMAYYNQIFTVITINETWQTLTVD